MGRACTFAADAGSILLGRGQRRRRGAGQRVGRSGDAGPLDRRRPLVQAAVRHPLRRSRRPAEPQRPRLAGADRHDELQHGNAPRLAVRRRDATAVRRRQTLPQSAGKVFGPAEINLGARSATQRHCIPTTACTGDAPAAIRAGTAQTGVLGTTSVNPVYLNKWFEYAGMQTTSYWWSFLIGTFPRTTPSSYGSPPDPFGVGAVGLDQAGRPVYVGMNYRRRNVRRLRQRAAQLPYQLNLGPNVARGLPSTVRRPTIRSARRSWSGCCGRTTGTRRRCPPGWRCSRRRRRRSDHLGADRRSG